MIKWHQNPPKKDGLYFRVNAGHRVNIHIVAGGVINWGPGGGTSTVELSNPKVQDPRWWWLGPFPYPPKESGIDGFIYKYGREGQSLVAYDPECSAPQALEKK